MINISEPVNSTTTSEVFSSNQTATQALISIYNYLYAGGGNQLRLGNGAITLYCGLSADELQYYPNSAPLLQFQGNTLTSDNTLVSSQLWAPAYFLLYQCNAIINGLQASAAIDTATKKQLTGEAKFIRAFVNFYLTSLFGDIPLVNTNNWEATDSLHRAKQAAVYQQILLDLKDAQSVLPADYSIAGSRRIRANSVAATALLARLYLYMGDWPNAEIQATAVINNSNYSLAGNLNNVFTKNSNEAILQLQVDSTLFPYAPIEGASMTATASPLYYLTSQLLASFEQGDRRLSAWVASKAYTIGGITKTYFYPYKYTQLVGTLGNVSQYYLLLRLAEQYLIRAEARAQQNNLTDAVSDLNTIRNRAGLKALPFTLNQQQVLDAVLQERRVELFAEWGHRWMDLKRTGLAHNVLSTISYKQPWVGDYQFLYPIPNTELLANPNLIQNTGY